MSEKLTKAKSFLILDQPFFASMLFSMPLIEDTTIETLATNGDEIRYNPSFLETMSLQETIFMLAHEVMHSVFEHMDRRGQRDHARWNIAADYIINGMLVNERVGTMPSVGLRDDALVAKGNGTTEGVYDLLPESDSNKSPGDTANGGSLDNVQDSAQDEATRAQKTAERRVNIVNAKNAAKMSGKLSAGLDRMLSDALRSKVDWKSILRRFLTERAKTEYSFSKPKRRFLADDMLLPSLQGEKLGEIVVAIDCSGSVDEKQLNEFASEVKAICQDIKPELVRVLYFDSEVLKAEVFTSDDEVTLTPCCGGGTAFSPIWKHIEANDMHPVACVVLTDLQCGDFGESPRYPVLFASTDLDKAPFGEIVSIK